MIGGQTSKNYSTTLRRRAQILSFSLAVKQQVISMCTVVFQISVFALRFLDENVNVTIVSGILKIHYFST